MPDTITPNYDLIKPEVTGSIDTWGSKLNGNFDALDAALKPVADMAGVAMLQAGTLLQRTSQDFLFLKAGLDPSLQSGDAIMNNSGVRALLNALCPVGTILMWGGTIATIPPGWTLCDGRTVGSVVTPNLIDKFVRAAGGVNAPGFQGGNSVFTYNGVVGGHILTTAEIAAHAHAIYDPGHVHGVSDPTHAHSVAGGGGLAALPIGAPSGGTVALPSGQNTAAAYTGIGIAAAVTGIQTYNAGSSQAHNHPLALAIAAADWYPAFYTLVFMMRTQAF